MNRTIVLDIECNSLVNPTKIWLAIAKDVTSEELFIFRNLDKEVTDVLRIEDILRFKELLQETGRCIGHNILGYDLPVIGRLLSKELPLDTVEFIDTLIVSKLVNYSRKEGHSLASYGEELGLPKLPFS